MPPLDGLEVLQSLGDHDGARPPLVFVHGVCHGAWCWENYLSWFAERGYDCHALSLRGHAGSAGRERLDTFGLADYVEDVRTVVDALPRAPVLVGHSMGGAIVQQYLADDESSIKAAVLLASAVPGGLGTAWMLRTALRNRPRGMRAARDVTRGRPVAAADVAATPFFGNRIDLAGARRWAALLQPESKAAVAHLRIPYTDRYDVRLPILVLGSRADRLFSAYDVRRTAAAYGVEAVLFDDLCHDMQLDPEWEGPARAILGFVEQAVG